MKKEFGVWLLIVMFGLLMSLILILAPKVLSNIYLHNDFYDYWIGSKLWWSDQSPYFISNNFKLLKNTYGLEFHWASGYSYPPFLAVILYPLQLVSPKIVAIVWYVMNIGLYLWFVWKWYKRTNSMKVVVFLLSFTPAIFSILVGQINIIILCLFEVVFFGHKSWIKALSLAVISVIKVYPAVISIIWLKSKLVRVWLHYGLLTLILIGLPMIFFGHQETVRYWTKVLPWLQSSADPYFAYQGIPSVISRFYPNNGLDTKAVSYGIMSALGVGLYLSFKQNKNETCLMLIILSWLTMLSGRNTFWNFLPLVYLYIWPVIEYGKLTNISRILTVTAILMSNVGWYWTYFSSNPFVVSMGVWSLLVVLVVIFRERDRNPFSLTRDDKIEFV